MAVNLSPVYGAGAQLFDNNGVPLAGGLIYTYAAGTSTPQATYTNSLGNIQHSNPIVLDASGRVPGGEIWLTDGLAYKFVVQTANAVLIASYDNLTGINSNFVAFTSQEETQTATQGQTVFTLITMQYQPGTDNLLVFVNGSKQIVSQNYTETSGTVVTFADGLNIGDVVDFTTAIPIASNATTAANVSYKENGSGSVTRTVQLKLQEIRSVLDFGAIPNNNSLSTAQTNREAFRNACCSYLSEWTAQQAAGTNISVYVPPGDYNLSNGFTVPPGVSLYGDGIGSARIHCLASTADSTQIPLISIGKVINDGTGALQSANGTYVVAPAAQIDNLYINPQNGNTAIDITDVPGFCIGKLWIQAAVGINIAGTTSDGIIDQIIFDSETAIGIQFGDTAQNVTINSLYSFVTGFPVYVTGTPNNIDIGILQCNYTQDACITFAPSSASGRIRINDFVCNQNAQYSTFISSIYIQGTSCDLSIGNMDARNYNGYAIDGGGGTSNNIYIDRMFLRQTPNRPSYTTGSAAKGVNVNGISVVIGYFDAFGLNSQSFLIQGSGISTLKVMGGTIGTNNTTNPEFYITNTNSSSYVIARNINNFSNNNLFATQANVPINYPSSNSVYKVATQGGRLAINIPFVGNANAWEITIYADTLPGGSPSYGRAVTLLVAQETIYDSSALKTRLYANPILQSPDSAYPPSIAYQLDLQSVGTGTEIAAVTYGYAVISIPSSYTNYTFNVRQL